MESVMDGYSRLWSDEVENNIKRLACSWDEQQRPPEIVFCKRCVLSNQRPRITFDDEGVCSACRHAERKNGSIDWAAREGELSSLLAKHRRKSGYDVVVPCSGGKDSAFVADTLKREYGMHPLCVKWAPFIYTDIGRKNLDRFIQSGFDVIVGHPNGLIQRKLARLAFEYLGDAFQPFTYGQLCYPMHMAHKFGIGLVFFGENGEAEYGGDSSANDKPCWDSSDWARVYHKGSGVERLKKIGLELGAFSAEEAANISEFYALPEVSACELPQFHWLGYYKKWHPQANFYHACEYTGFAPNTERSEGTYSKYASLDDKTDGFHYYMAYQKFGMGRATSDAAHEIRDGDITREEGVALVKRFDFEFPAKNFRLFLDYIGCDEPQFWRVVNRFRPPHLWNMDDVLDSAWLKKAVYD